VKYRAQEKLHVFHVLPDQLDSVRTVLNQRPNAILTWLQIWAGEHAPATDTAWSRINMTNNIEQMISLARLFNEKDFQFDIHHAYFTRTNKLLHSHSYSTLKDEWESAFRSASDGYDGRKQLATVWCNWLV
jgi:hypothetical protein